MLSVYSLQSLKKLDIAKRHFKPTDTHALLHKTSYHPKHTYRGIVKSQLIRFYRICTKQVDVEVATRILFKALKSRGYSRTFLRSIKSEVTNSRSVIQTERVEANDNIIPLVTTFSSTSTVLNRMIKAQFAKLQETVGVWSNFKIISAFRRNKNLKDLLVHTDFQNSNSYKTLERDNIYLLRRKFITNKMTGLSAPVWRDIEEKACNLIYAIECKTCGVLYIGETKNTLLQRLKQHLYYIDRSNKSTKLYEHFRDHGSKNLCITGLEQNLRWTKYQRLFREKHWIQSLKTLDPCGLNEVV